jgi:hypothetical protein
MDEKEKSDGGAFARICRAEREQILEEWRSAVFATYPLDTSGFARTREDRFGNPAGHAVREALESMYDAVGGEPVSEGDLRLSMEMFIKLRAVQDFTPVQALGVIYLLKPLLRKRLLPACLREGLLDAFLEAESRLDSSALIAFDIYTAGRTRIFEERMGEIRRQYAQIARWAQKAEGAGKLPADEKPS